MTPDLAEVARERQSEAERRHLPSDAPWYQIFLFDLIAERPPRFSPKAEAFYGPARESLDLALARDYYQELNALVQRWSPFLTISATQNP